MNAYQVPISLREAIEVEREFPGLLHDILTYCWNGYLIDEQINGNPGGA